MNKLLTLAAACTLALGFTACEDVPSPYGLPTEKQQPNRNDVKDVLLEETFASSFGSFKNYTTSGDGAWKIDFKTAKASGYDNAAKKTTAGTYYLVSSEVDLTGVENAYVTLDYILRYNKGDENQQLLITDHFDPAHPDQGWTVLNQQWTEGSDWKTFANEKIAVPAAFLGKKVYIAFRYNTDDKSGSTWEIKNLKVQRGVVTPSTPEQPVTPGNGIFIDESFAASLGAFTSQTTSGEGAWKVDFKSAKASGYDNASKKTTAGTYYLVSPEVDLTAAKTEGAHVALEYILRYNKADANQQLLITDAYNPAQPEAGWTVLNQKWTEGKDWKSYTSANFDIPTAFLGKKVRIAFRYTSDNKSGSTWQVKNVKLALGHLDQPVQPTPTPTPDPAPKPTPDPAPAPSGNNLLSNAGFESWDATAPAVWKSSIGNATLSQSTTAHGGQYAVKVTGDARANKRLSYAELSLKAGTYTFSFYVNGAEANAHLKTGYAIMTDHKVADYKTDYLYGNSTAVPQGTWTLVTHTFKLDQPKTICLLIMNQKGSGAFLVDDATLSTTDGGVQ